MIYAKTLAGKTNIKYVRLCGFFSRMKSKNGSKVIKSRRSKGRKRIAKK
jgi:ribosomal protein L34